MASSWLLWTACARVRMAEGPCTSHVSTYMPRMNIAKACPERGFTSMSGKARLTSASASLLVGARGVAVRSDQARVRQVAGHRGLWGHQDPIGRGHAHVGCPLHHLYSCIVRDTDPAQHVLSTCVDSLQVQRAMPIGWPAGMLQGLAADCTTSLGQGPWAAALHEWHLRGAAAASALSATGAQTPTFHAAALACQQSTAFW